MALPTLSSRREFIGKSSLGLVVLTTSVGCGKMRFTCTDTTGLSEPDKATRTKLAYMDTSADPNKKCLDCAQWVPPTQASGCGSCKLLKGPVHPDGTCNVFTKKS
jgi:hypothetical protein